MATIFVDINASGGNNGSSFVNAFTDLQSALAVAGNGDQIFVADGTYTPTDTTDRDISFVIPSGVEVFGGFSGNETELSQRNIEENVTILSGNIGNDSAGDNSHQVVDISDTSASTILDGFTITEGNANGDSASLSNNQNSGAGIFGADANAQLNNLIIINNSAIGDGGGLFLARDSNGSVNNVTFIDNSASDEGGAIFVQIGGNSLNLTNSLFINNQSTGGGAIHTDRIDLLNVINNTFINNQGGIADALFDDDFQINANRTIANNIFADDAAIPNQQLLLEDTTSRTETITVSNNIFQGGATLPGEDDVIGAGNLTDTDPLFVDPANGDFRLQLTSPGIDAGDNNFIGSETDLSNNPRIFNSTVDIGAIEFGVLLSIDSAPTIIEGDEGNTNAEFTVTLLDTLGNPATEEITVNFTAISDTAIASSDFEPTAGTLTFSPGTTTQTINVPIIGDQLLENDETFSVELGGVTGNALIANSTSEITITNDDPQRQISIADATILEGNSGISSLDFTLSLDQEYVEPITVDFNLVGNLAIADEDFNATNGTITFNPGETTQTLSVGIIGDEEFEASETFFVELSNPSSAAIIQDEQATGTITNDDLGAPLLESLDTPITRFQNSNIPGTFLFANPSESNSIRANFPQFVEEGTAFRVADEPGEGLNPIYRFQSANNPGTFLFANEAERQSINANFSSSFNEEGIAFFVFSASSGIGETLTRFQNSDLPGTFIFASPSESNLIRSNFPQFIEEGAAFNVAF